MLGLVRLCESRGWDFQELGVGGLDSQHKTMYRIEGDLVDAPTVMPAVAAAVGKAAVMRARAGFPSTQDEQAQLDRLCKEVGILPL